jgi:hypothetical protein
MFEAGATMMLNGKQISRIVVISALKFLFIRVLDLPLEFTHRPRADRRLPGVLSRPETIRIINSPKNLKHRLILSLAYSGDRRRGHYGEITEKQGTILRTFNLNLPLEAWPTSIRKEIIKEKTS